MTMVDFNLIKDHIHGLATKLWSNNEQKHQYPWHLMNFNY
jgi:hypothetical protein